MNMIFDNKVIDFESEPLMLGTGVNVVRLDMNLDPFLERLFDRALGLMWFKNDFSYADDGACYNNLPQELKDLFLKNLKFQTLLDSIAARTVAEVFIPISTNGQNETWLYLHSFFEGAIHSPTYAEIVKALPLDAKKIFDDIMINSNIIDRGRDITDVFNETVKYNSRMILKDEIDVEYNVDEHKKLIVLSLYALNILEAMLFQSSFLVSFAFKENGMMNATGDAITKISLDEKQHYAYTVYMINKHKKDPEWTHIFNEVEDKVIDLYSRAIKADYLWIDYVFEDGAKLLGISNQILKHFVDYNAYKVMSAIGLKPLTNKSDNPCSWADKYTKIDNIQTAQKEKEGISYKLGIIDTTMTNNDWKDLFDN